MIAGMADEAVIERAIHDDVIAPLSTLSPDDRDDRPSEERGAGRDLVTLQYRPRGAERDGRIAV